MERYIIKGGTPLNGEVEISGAKNAALGLLAAAIMTDEEVTIDNLPDVSDINHLIDAIANIGATVYAGRGAAQTAFRGRGCTPWPPHSVRAP